MIFSRQYALLITLIVILYVNKYFRQYYNFRQWSKNKKCIKVKNFNMYIPDNTHDGVFNSLIKDKIWEPKITKIIENRIQKHKIDKFIDIGANIGYYALLAKSLGVKCIYAFEPFNKNYKLLINNIKLNNYRKIYSYNKCLSNKNGTHELYYNNTKYGHCSYKENIKNIQHLDKAQKIDCITLDSLNITGIIGIKIDVEGAEYDVIQGMKKMIQSKNIKFIVMEISPKFIELNIICGMIDYLKKNFTKLYDIDNGIKDIYNINMKQYLKHIKQTNFLFEYVKNR